MGRTGWGLKLISLQVSINSGLGIGFHMELGLENQTSVMLAVWSQIPSCSEFSRDITAGLLQSSLVTKHLS